MGAVCLRLRLRVLLASCFLTSGAFRLLEYDIVWHCPHVVCGIIHRCYGIGGGRDSLWRVYRRCQLCKTLCGEWGHNAECVFRVREMRKASKDETREALKARCGWSKR